MARPPKDDDEAFSKKVSIYLDDYLDLFFQTEAKKRHQAKSAIIRDYLAELVDVKMAERRDTFRKSAAAQ